MNVKQETGVLIKVTDAVSACIHTQAIHICSQLPVKTKYGKKFNFRLKLQAVHRL